MAINTHTLRPRETQAIQQIAAGLTPAQAAAGMGISLASVQAYLTSARRKVGALDMVGLVARAYASGQIPKPERVERKVHLTPVQQDILPLLGAGHSPDDIAEKLSLKLPMVRAECRALRETLGAKSAAHVITCARQYGLTT